MSLCDIIRIYTIVSWKNGKTTAERFELTHYANSATRINVIGKLRRNYSNIFIISDITDRDDNYGETYINNRFNIKKV